MEYLSVTQAANFLHEYGKKTHTVGYIRFMLHNLCNDGGLEGAKKMGYLWAIPCKSIERMAEEMYGKK